jgi:Ca2+/H+ antiporter
MGMIRAMAAALQGMSRVRQIAYGVTLTLTVAVVAVELLHASVLLIFALTSLALIGLAWVLGQATESLGTHAGPPSATQRNSSSPSSPSPPASRRW